MLRGAVRQGLCAVVALDTGPDDGADLLRRPDVQDRLDRLAASWRGTTSRTSAGPAVVVVFTVAPRAVGFAAALRDEVGPGVRAAVHVGEVQHHEGQVHGATVTLARELVGRTAPGEVRVSPAVRDLVGDPPGARFEEVGEPDAPSWRLDRRGDVPAAGGVPTALVDEVAAAVTSSRLVMVVAPSGTGKTTLLRAVAERHPAAWVAVPPGGWPPATLARRVVDALRIRVPGLPASLTEFAAGIRASSFESRARAEALAAAVGEVALPHLSAPLLLVVDGADELATDSACRALLDAVVRQAPPSLHVVLLARRDPGLRTARLERAGEVTTVDADRLRLDDAAVTALATERLGAPATDERVRRVVATAGGHAETAVLTAATLRRGHAPSTGPGALAHTLVRGLDAVEEDVVTALAAVGRASRELLGTLVPAASAQTLDRLVADGLARPVGPEDEELELGAAARAAVEVPAEVVSRTCEAGAAVLRAGGDPAGALALLCHGDVRPGRVQAVRRDGQRLLGAGHWQVVLDAVGPAADDPDTTSWGAADGAPLADDPVVAALVGEAWRLAGDQARARRWFERATAGPEPVLAWTAWRHGLLLHFAGDLDRALALYDRTDLDDAADDDPDVALVHAWAGAAAWLRGDVDRCRASTTRALAVATASGDDRAQAAALTVRALLAASDGDRAANDRYYLRALDHAEAAGDLLQLVRIRGNRGSRLLEEGEHVAALAELEEALRLADAIGASEIQAMALSNRGQVLGRLGQLDEATADLTASRDLFERVGSRWVAYALCHLGDIHRLRGDRGAAQAAYRECLAQSEPVGDVQGIVPALTGLALVTVDDDPGRARELADRACAHPDALGHVEALAALAEVAAAQGDTDAAAEALRAGIELARQRRDRPGLARLLELRARGAERADDAEATALLREARDLWSRMSCELETARVDVALAARAPDAVSLARAEEAVRVLRSHGARGLADAAAEVVDRLHATVRAPVQARVLGPLQVQVRGRILPRGELPPPDACDLLVHLVAHRGRPPAPGRVADQLFGDDPDGDARLASAADALAAWLADHDVPVPSVLEAGLDGAAVDSDLDRFRAAADRGLDHLGADAAAAEADLVVAEATHRGELHEGAAPAGWLQVARDELAETHLQVALALVDLAERRGDHHQAVRLLLRVLERDAHDEGAHLRLVACLEGAGRRGEARRRYRTYASRMQEIGVEPAPFPELTEARPPR